MKVHNMMFPSLSRTPFASSRGVSSRGKTGRPSFSARAAVAVLALALTVPFLPLGGAPAQARGAPDSFADLAERLLPAVVNISATQVNKKKRRLPEMPQFPPGSPFEEFFRDFFDRNQRDSKPRKSSSLGSGFIIGPSGYVVTNNHVIEDAEEITVILQDDTNLKAKIIGRDKKTDLALLKVVPKKPLPFVKWGDSTKSRVGDWILAIGNPFGLGGTVTAGIISASKRDINSGPYDSYLQTDASINRGNSGGPMFNLKGNVIGVNTAIYSPSGGSIGIGFAIPAAQARVVIDQLRKFGRTRRGWLGVRIQTVTKQIAESLELGKPRGALVAGVNEKGPAKESGLKAGDVIVTFDGQPVEEMRDLPRIVAETPIDKTVKLKVWRSGDNGKTLELSVTIGELPEDVKTAKATIKNKSAVEMLGMTLTELNDPLRRRYKLDSRAQGVLVLDVKEGSAGKKGGLQPGDLIVEVAPDTVGTPKEFQARIDKARKAKRKTVLLLTERKKVRQFIVLPVI
jgi:serine protease Do